MNENMKTLTLNIRLSKSTGNYPYSLGGEIYEQNVCCGFGSPITEEEFKDVDSEIERKRKSYEEQEKANVKVVMIEDCRARQTTLWV